MTYLKHVQEKNTAAQGCYEPEVICKCGNFQPGDSPAIKIDTCDCCEDAALVSTCCCAKPYCNIHEFDGEHFGLCGDCKEHTDFEKEECCE